jgi:hypothetical protein
VITHLQTGGIRRSFALAFAAATILTAALTLAVPAKGAVREVGATSMFTAPACDNELTCQVLTRMTVFQLKAGNRSNVSRVPHHGRLVAFTVNLPQVIAKFYADFNATYSGAPTVRIAVLRRAPRKGVTKYRYKLVAQGPRMNVKNYLGSTPSFVLAKPLSVKKGDLIALTTDTWMPGFVVRPEDSASTWRSSRPKGKCTAKGKDKTNLITPQMHEKIDQIRQYNCGFVGARVLYHATVVDRPVTTSK